MNFRVGQPLVAQKLKQVAVHIAHSGGVDQPGLQRHTKAGIDAFAVFNGADRGRPAQMTGNGLIRFPACLFVEYVGNIPMGCAVIAKALYTVFFIPLIGYAIQAA